MVVAKCVKVKHANVQKNRFLLPQAHFEECFDLCDPIHCTSPDHADYGYKQIVF